MTTLESELKIEKEKLNLFFINNDCEELRLCLIGNKTDKKFLREL